MDYRRLDDFVIDRVAQPASDWVHQTFGTARQVQIRIVIHSLAALIFFMVIYAWNQRSTWFDDVLIMSFFMRLASLFQWLHSLTGQEKDGNALPVDRLVRCFPRMFELGFLGVFIVGMCLSPDVLGGCFIANSFLDLTIEYLRACRPNPPRKAHDVAVPGLPEIWNMG